MADLMHTIYTDVAGFQADALSVLKQDLTLNTVCLSELNLIKPDDQAPGTYMAIYHCKQCSNKHHCVALSAGSRGGSHRLYLSESVCPALAKYIIEQLQQQGCTIPSLTAVDRVAGLLADESGFSGRQINNIMVLPPHAAAAAARPAAATGLSLKLLSRDSQSDVDFIMLWSTNFIQASMGSPILPPEQIVKSFVLPWLTEGQYVLAVQADDVPVCMLCHMQTSESSCRIVWVYTPPEHRRQGHARTAVAQLCDQLKERYQHISLLVSDNNHTAIRVYKDIGFVDAGVLVTADKPGFHYGYAIPKQPAGAADTAANTAADAETEEATTAGT